MNNTSSLLLSSFSITNTLDHRYTVDTHQHECAECAEWEDCAEVGAYESCPQARGTVRRGGPFYCKDCAEDRF